MKRKLILMLGQCAFTVLRGVDQLLGRRSGMSRDEEVEDPYRMWRTVREANGNVVRSYENRGWMVLGFEEAQALFRDSKRFSSDIRRNAFLSNAIRAASPDGRVAILDDPSMLQLDPPDHTRLRKLVNHGFGQKYITALEPRIEHIVSACLDTYDAESGRYDVVEQLAKPLPAIVIAELLGLPESDRGRFQDLSDRLLNLTAIGDDDRMRDGTVANEELIAYFADVIEEKRRHPGQDLIDRLIEAEEEGDKLTAEEMYSTCLLMLVAGHETTTRLISNGVYTLLKHPDQLEKLKGDPELIPNAVEEILRYEPPVQLMPRYAVEDTVFFGRKVKKGQLIAPVIASANRDPAANDDPDVFDVTRKDIRHVAFGHGIHLCLGLNLARLEARVAFRRLFERFPSLTLAEQDIEWTELPLVRGSEHLIIETNEHGRTRRVA